MTKILSFVQDDDFIRVTTDNPGRPDFVYETGRFSSAADLLAEIDRSIAAEALRAQKKQSKKVSLSSDLVSSGAKDDSLIDLGAL